MPPNTTLWKLESHTIGKHLVLKNYMDAWLPIMTKWNENVLFVDGFAGPGEYLGGELGSPLIALEALVKHTALNRMNGNIHYLFMEERADRAEHLEGLLETKKCEMPRKCSYQVANSSFDETLNQALDEIEKRNRTLAPAFVMIDPFGVSGIPMRTIGRILGHPKSEVYVSVMYESINRFREHPNFEQHLNELFGCRDWLDGVDMVDPDERKEFFFELYKRQLRKSGAKHVVHFELYEGNQLVYAIFFGTQSLEGNDKMKQAIWKVAPFGDYKFRGSRIGQLTFGDRLLFKPLETALYDKFVSQSWVTIGQVTDFVKSDATEYHTGHLRRLTLIPMERDGSLMVQRPPGKRSGFPEGTRLRFVQGRNQQSSGFQERQEKLL